MSLLVATVLLPRALRGVVLPETSRVAEEEQARAWAAEAAIGAIERAQLARLLPTSTSAGVDAGVYAAAASRSEEHTSELQSQSNLVCRLLLEKKKKTKKTTDTRKEKK